MAGLVPGVAAGQAATGPVEIPLELRDGRLLVPVFTADGTELTFALSTGAAVTLFSEAGAARVADASLTLGGLSLATDDARTISDDRLLLDGRPLDGMIGSNTLNQYDMLIDTPRNRLVLKPIGAPVAWEGVKLSEPARLRIYHGVVLGLDVVWNGKPYPATLDLGTPSVILNPDAGAEAGIDGEGSGTLAIGPAIREGVSAQVLDLDLFERWVPNGGGFVLLGAPITKDCAVAISWVQREIRMCAS